MSVDGGVFGGADYMPGRHCRGPEKLRRYGWQLIGFAYRYTGERDSALAAFRRAAAMTPPEERERPGSASRKVQIALLSGEAADFQAARELLHRMLDGDEHVGAARMSLLNSLFQLEAREGNPEAASVARHQLIPSDLLELTDDRRDQAPVGLTIAAGRGIQQLGDRRVVRRGP
jgi:tetratricopeptide (TPR) repeat protein